MVDIAELPQYQPSGDLNEQLLNNLRIMKVAKDKGLAISFPTVGVSGHVDSGKSTLTALMLTEVGKIAQSTIQDLVKAAEEKAQSEKQDFNAATMVNVAHLVEKGKEAKNRGMTIETNVHRVFVPTDMTVVDGSDKHKEAVELLKEMDIKYEEHKEGANCRIHYSIMSDIVDCPGHKNYVHNTAMAIGESAIQILLYPSNAGEDMATFLKMVGPESLSMAHAQLGITSGKVLILCLSKSELAFDKIAERSEVVKTAVKKKCGVPMEKLVIVPVTNKGLKAHNVVTPTDMPELREQFTNTKFKMMIPDYRDSTIKYETDVNLSCVFDAVRYYPPVIHHFGTFNNQGALLSVSCVAMTAHGRVLVCVVLNGAVKNGATVMSTQHQQPLTITSMEQFKNAVEFSATGAHIGIKVKAVNRTFDIKNVVAGDLLHCDYPKDNEPKMSSYAKVKIVYNKNRAKAVAGQKIQKETIRKIGSSPLLILGRRESIKIVHVYSLKEAGKKEEVMASEDKPITEIPPGVVTALIKFSKPTCFPTISQSRIHSQGPVLEHHNQVGSLKIIEHVSDEDGQKLDRVYAEEMAKNAKKARPGQKKKK